MMMRGIMSNFWLFKSEPNAYSFTDLMNDGITEWDGVRNFQVRNWLRDSIKTGDQILFWHSNTNLIGVVGTAIVVKDGYPDHTAWDPSSDYPDSKSSPDKPIWYMVDIKPQKQFKHVVTMSTLREHPNLVDMIVLRKGNRLSITPVTQFEFDTVVEIAEGL